MFFANNTFMGDMQSEMGGFPVLLYLINDFMDFSYE